MIVVSLIARTRCSVPGGRAVLLNPAHIHRFSRRSLARTLSETGFEILESYNHSFTSALAVQVLKVLDPALKLLITPAPGQELRAPSEPAATAALP